MSPDSGKIMGVFDQSMRLSNCSVTGPSMGAMKRKGVVVMTRVSKVCGVRSGKAAMVISTESSSTRSMATAASPVVRLIWTSGYWGRNCRKRSGKML